MGISLSEAVRRCVADRLAAERVELGREELVREALAVVGKYADPKGASPVARDHDEHHSEAAASAAGIKIDDPDRAG